MIGEEDFKGTEIQSKEGELCLKLIQCLPNPYKAKVRIYAQMHDPGMLQTDNSTEDRR